MTQCKFQLNNLRVTDNKAKGNTFSDRLIFFFMFQWENGKDTHETIKLSIINFQFILKKTTSPLRTEW